MVIVLVDSDTSCLNQLVSAVKDYDKEYTIITYQNASSALEYVMSHPVDMVISEVILNGMDGYTLSIKLKNLKRGIHVVLMSEDKSKAMQAWNVHANYFLTKPFTAIDVKECFVN